MMVSDCHCAIGASVVWCAIADYCSQIKVTPGISGKTFIVQVRPHCVCIGMHYKLELVFSVWKIECPNNVTPNCLNIS